jgi:hypothetical protein
MAWQIFTPILFSAYMYPSIVIRSSTASQVLENFSSSDKLKICEMVKVEIKKIQLYCMYSILTK